MNREQLRQRLEFYRDLGVKEIYKRAKTVPLRTGASEPTPEVAPPTAKAQAGIVIPRLEPEGDSLQAIRDDIGDCRRCTLCEKRKTIVFGSGSESARLVFVGEGPGADEDEQGLPFVGRAGQLLTQMIDNTATREGIPIRRADVYICNVVKCRPRKIARRCRKRWKRADSSSTVSSWCCSRKPSVRWEQPQPRRF